VASLGPRCKTEISGESRKETDYILSWKLFLAAWCFEKLLNQCGFTSADDRRALDTADRCAGSGFLLSEPRWCSVLKLCLALELEPICDLSFLAGAGSFSGLRMYTKQRKLTELKWWLSSVAYKKCKLAASIPPNLESKLGASSSNF